MFFLALLVSVPDSCASTSSSSCRISSIMAPIAVNRSIATWNVSFNVSSIEAPVSSKISEFTFLTNTSAATTWLFGRRNVDYLAVSTCLIERSKREFINKSKAEHSTTAIHWTLTLAHIERIHIHNVCVCQQPMRTSQIHSNRSFLCASVSQRSIDRDNFPNCLSSRPFNLFNSLKFYRKWRKKKP